MSIADYGLLLNFCSIMAHFCLYSLEVITRARFWKKFFGFNVQRPDTKLRPRSTCPWKTFHTFFSLTSFQPDADCSSLFL